MKRSYLKRKPCKLKRSKVKEKSAKGKLLIECDKLFRQIILRERINRCEWCWKVKGLSVSHILPKGRYSRLRYFKANVLLLCTGCHIFKWHKSPLEAAKFMVETRGEDYEDKLKVYDKTLPKLTLHQSQIYKFAFEQELKGKK